MPTAWKGSLNFGLVNIPITLYPAFKSKEMEFHLLHRLDHGRIGYRKVCKKCGKELSPDEIVKAYEHEKDAYIPMEKEELEEGKAPNTRSLAIELFVEEGAIDTKLYERPYYVMPAKEAEKPYVLLREAIRSSGRIGVGKIQFSNKEHLAALKVDGPAIVLNLMHFLDEMEDPKLLAFPSESAAIGKKEMDLAKQLVSALAGPFDPGQFRDTHGERLREAVQGKVEAEAKAARKAGKAAGGDRKVIDLMERLQRSLGGEDWSAAPAAPKAGGRGAKAKPGAKAKAKAAAREPEADHGPERHYRKRKAG